MGYGVNIIRIKVAGEKPRYFPTKTVARRWASENKIRKPPLETVPVTFNTISISRLLNEAVEQGASE